MGWTSLKNLPYFSFLTELALHWLDTFGELYVDTLHSALAAIFSS